MKRRTFISQGTLVAGGLHFRSLFSFGGLPKFRDKSLYERFKDPENDDRPFARWWWNGDKIEKDELSRELRVLRTTGIGGVEINPIKFPARTDDLGKTSIQWLSDEWIDLLQHTLNEAGSLGITCDLIVGSGWPLGAEWLKDDERSQIVVITTQKFEGPLEIKIAIGELMKEASPPISSPFPERQFQLISLSLVPSAIDNISDVQDLTGHISNGFLKYHVPPGAHVLYALVKIEAFMQVIQGAPGATGPVLNHYNKKAVQKFLEHMSERLQEKSIGIATHFRSFFSDSLELEGANWCADMQAEFEKRRGYDIMSFLPFILYKIGSMGNTWNYEHAAEHNPGFEEMIRRMRYDFELTKTELIKERFVEPFIAWCKKNKVKSRMQAYGRGYALLDGSLDADIPECETWIRPGLGAEMSVSDYRTGRAYTMINKYVSSAAHLKNKRHISCEELTNIHMVFNESLELIKIAGDQSIISGATHSIFHGFNYSPPAAAFPGWVIYGTFLSERNPWWPYFRYFVEYKARLSALLLQATMFTDIAVLPPITDMWSIYGAQNEPFPAVMYPEWQTLIWEAIHQNGNACDYISEKVIVDADMRNGRLHYGARSYHTIFLIMVESMAPATARKLFDFVSSGGRIFCIDKYIAKGNGWNDHQIMDNEVQEWVDKMKQFPDLFILLEKPGENVTQWYRSIQERYGIDPYVTIHSPNPFVSQVRYQAKNTEILLFANSSMNDSFEVTITPSALLKTGNQAWIWDAESGERYSLSFPVGNIVLDMGPAEMKVIVFDNEKEGPLYKEVNTGKKMGAELRGQWTLEGTHINGTTIKRQTNLLADLKEIAEWTNFCGSISYKTNFDVNDENEITWMNLGKVAGVSELIINGQNVGMRWYGRRIYDIGKVIRNGANEIEIKIVTTMGNYLKSMGNNPIAQFWTNEGRTIQPLQTMGLMGPVTIY